MKSDSLEGIWEDQRMHRNSLRDVRVGDGAIKYSTPYTRTTYEYEEYVCLLLGFVCVAVPNLRL